jgi:hypothetical protein
MDDKKMPKNAEFFVCKKCDFKCYKQSNYKNHLKTMKHLRIQNDIKKMPQNTGSTYDCLCGKKYKHYSGLWRHHTCGNCLELISQNEDDNEKTYDEKYEEENAKILTNLVFEVVKQNKELITQNNHTQKQNQELTKQLFEICKNGTNNTMIHHNSYKTFNLTVFLNEQCKDAMNIMEFVDSLKIQLSDLENVGKLGYVDGISNIIVKNLKAMDVHKRPVHCSDSKREVMYVKDENKWEKENEENKKLRKAIKYIAHKNSKLLPEFKSKYPDCVYSDSKKSDQYNKIIVESMGGQGDNDNEKEDKIIRRIAKEVVIDKTDV